MVGATGKTINVGLLKMVLAKSWAFRPKNGLKFGFKKIAKTFGPNNRVRVKQRIYFPLVSAFYC